MQTTGCLSSCITHYHLDPLTGKRYRTALNTLKIVVGIDLMTSSILQPENEFHYLAVVCQCDV